MKLNNYDKMVELYHMMKDDPDLRKTFYANDYPVPYKELTLFPVQVDLYYYFHFLVQCLLLPHKTSGDINAISKSYFKYLCYLATDKNKPEYIFYLSELLLIVLRKPKFYSNSDKKEISTINIFLDKGTMEIEGHFFTEKDFDIIREIILEQNAIEIPDESISPELVQAYKEREEFRLKQSQVKMCSFEDQINIVVAKSSYRRDEVIKMTIRSFSRLLERVDKIMDYEIKSLLRPHMDEKEQKRIEHYMADTEMTMKEKCEKSFTDMQALKKKVEG